MCVIVYKPKGITLAKQVARQCWEANPDGGGLAWVEGDKVVISKGFFSFNRMWRVIRDHQQESLLIHFRIKTSGKIDGPNTHPFRVTDQLVMAHNGSLSVVSGEGERSDTRVLAEDYLVPLAERWPKFYLEGWNFVEKLFTYRHGGKLLFFNEKGEGFVTDKNAWAWERGCLFSNTYWKTRGIQRQESWAPGRHFGENYQYSTPNKPATWLDARAQLIKHGILDKSTTIGFDDTVAIARAMKYLVMHNALSGDIHSWFKEYDRVPGKRRSRKKGDKMTPVRFNWRGHQLTVYYNLATFTSDWAIFTEKNKSLVTVTPQTFESLPTKEKETTKIVGPSELIYGMRWHDWIVCGSCLNLDSDPESFAYLQGAGGQTLRKATDLKCEDCQGLLDEPVKVPVSAS